MAAVLQCVAVRCSVLPVCCSVLQYVTVWCIVDYMMMLKQVCCSVLQYVAMCCIVLQCGAVCCRVLQYVALLQSGTVCCGELKCVTI